MKNIVDLASQNKGGIGYAYNQFYSKMYSKENLKMVAIDNVKPTNENIVSGKYPFMFDIYCIYRKNNNKCR